MDSLPKKGCHSESSKESKCHGLLCQRNKTLDFMASLFHKRESAPETQDGQTDYPFVFSMAVVSIWYISLKRVHFI